jgi:hypothetical protein
MTAEEEKALEFADRLYIGAIEIVGAAHIEIEGNWNRDPKIIAINLLSRSISFFRGALVLMRENHVLEARVLARCLYENLLWIGALMERGTAFVEEMASDEAFNRKSLGELALRIASKKGGNVDDENGLKLRGLMNRLAEQYPDPKKLSAKQTAATGVVEASYVEYQRFSLDAVHCSITALGRHLSSERVGDKHTVVTINVEPTMLPTEFSSTIRHLCRALMGVAVAANEKVGFTSASEQLNSLVSEFERNGWVHVD